MMMESNKLKWARQQKHGRTCLSSKWNCQEGRRSNRILGRGALTQVHLACSICMHYVCAVAAARQEKDKTGLNAHKGCNWVKKRHIRNTMGWRASTWPWHTHLCRKNASQPYVQDPFFPHDLPSCTKPLFARRTWDTRDASTINWARAGCAAHLYEADTATQ